MNYFALLFSFLLALEPLQANDYWPQFRGPKGDGSCSSKKLPVQWSEKENIRWKVAIHDKGWSSPVIWGDQIWMTTAREDGKEFYAICVDRNNGKIIHDLKLFTEEKPAFCHPFNSYASPTPVVEEERVYVSFGSHGTACLNSKTGEVIWKRTDIKCDHYRGPGSSPMIFQDNLYLLFDGYDQQFVLALNKKTGDTIWRKDRDIKYSTDNGDLKKAYSTATILMMDNKPQLVCPAAEATLAYDPANGDEIWRVHHGGMNEASRPIFGHGLIYLTSGHTGNLFAVKQGLRGNLTKDGIVWKSNRGIPTRPSFLLVGDYLYMVSDNGVASCVDAKSGTHQWQERLGSAFSASPIRTDKHFYCCDQDGRTHVIELSNQYKVVSVNKLDDGCMASPAVAEDELFIRTKKHLYCITTKK